MNPALDKLTRSINAGDQDWCDAFDAFNADAVIGGEVSEAVCDQATLVALHCTHDMRAMADHEVRAGVNHQSGEFHDIAARFTVIFLFVERQMHGILSLGAAVK